MAFSHSSKARLTSHDLGRFAGTTLFDRVARAVCRAGCLPRKELYEAWEMARRVRRIFRGGRVVDVGGGHGLLGHVMLILDNSSPSALVVDTQVPPSSERLAEAVVGEWPRLAGRISHAVAPLAEVTLEPTDVVVSSHACGGLTDEVLDRAMAAGARVAVLPCCHDVHRSDTGALTGWLDGPLAIDVVRAGRVRARGYEVWTQTIPAEITPRNRLLLAAPAPRKSIPD